MNTGDFITSIAKTAGVSEDNESFVAVMANKDLATADFPDDLASAIQSALLTMDAAKNNSDLKSHFKAQALNAVDQNLEKFAVQYELGDDFIAKLKEKQGTYENMGLTFEKLNAIHVAKLEAAKTNTDDPKLKEAIANHIKEINGLKGKLSGMEDTHVEIKEMNEMRDGYEEMILNGNINGLLSNFNYANDTIDKSVNVITAKTLVEHALRDKGVKFVNDNGNTVLQTNDGMEYFVDNQKVGTQSFLDTVMSDHKLLKASDPNPPAPTPNGLLTPPVVVPANGTNNSAYLEAVRQNTTSMITELTKEN